MNLPEKLIKTFKEHIKSEDTVEYVNPNFVVDILTALNTYYGIEDMEVDEWAKDLWSQ